VDRHVIDGDRAVVVHVAARRRERGRAAAATNAAAPHSMLVILVCILVVSFVSCVSETVEGGRWACGLGRTRGERSVRLMSSFVASAFDATITTDRS
jgi:hypothetical protein